MRSTKRNRRTSQKRRSSPDYRRYSAFLTGTPDHIEHGVGVTGAAEQCVTDQEARRPIKLKGLSEFVIAPQYLGYFQGPPCRVLIGRDPDRRAMRA